MAQLLERPGYDHPDFDQLLPRIGCQVCGLNVQTVPQNRDGVRAAYQAENDDEDALRIRVAYEGPMAAWSHSHAAGHSEQEHREAAQRAGLG